MKSLVMRGASTHEPVLALVSGDNRADEARIEEAIGEPVERPDAAYVREVTGYSIGGIPPVGHPRALARCSTRTCCASRRCGPRRGTRTPSSRSRPRSLARAANARVMRLAAARSRSSPAATAGSGWRCAASSRAHGHEVILGARDKAKGERRRRNGLRVMQLDVADDASVERAGAARSSALDVLVNNAAILYDTWARAVDRRPGRGPRGARDEPVRRVAHDARPSSPTCGAARTPRIVNVSSGSGSLSGMSARHARLLASARRPERAHADPRGRARRDGILVNAVCPGWTDTDMGQGGRPVEKARRASCGLRNCPTTAPPAASSATAARCAW